MLKHMKLKLFRFLPLLLISAFLLCGCQSTSYSQEDIGAEPTDLDETTILGKWYFEGQEENFVEFFEDGTYVTNNEGEEGNGSYTLSDDYKTLHLKEETSSIDQDVDVMYGDDILYIIWSRTREQIFTRNIIED